MNVIQIPIPPLRERKDDIEPISKFFLKKYCISNNLEEKEISPEAIDALINHNWPGNIRELENTIHRAVLLSDDIITIKDLNLKFNNKLYQNSDEKNLILNTVNYCLGDINQAANILGISINKLSQKIKETTDA